MILVDGLTKMYGRLKAVDNLSFSVAGGEVIGLIGPNGAGKTSTLKCIVGIQAPSAGTIRIGGHDIVADPIEAKRRLAFMPDEPQLFDYLTVREHLALVARLYGVASVDERSRALLQELELAGKEGALPGELSRGMKQKLAIACGLLHDPVALLFDEPLTGLDPLGIRRMKQTIVSRARAGAAVVVSSHLLHLVEEICTRIVIINHGVKIADGTLGELAARADLASSDPDLEQIFLKATGHGDGGR
ncbi:MAG: ABC transporter ATP-binding protein [Acidobacteria bacterium]|nr:MAG: ABC transporter ATP-binding protein [Acidobacteriota bacterium]RPJ76359.1 MAG: ABC transporter ATP-binding protein [Acidobacteriota bacterium]